MSCSYTKVFTQVSILIISEVEDRVLFLKFEKLTGDCLSAGSGLPGSCDAGHEEPMAIR